MAIKNRYEFMYYVACTDSNQMVIRYGQYATYGSTDDAGVYFGCIDKTIDSKLCLHGKRRGTWYGNYSATVYKYE